MSAATRAARMRTTKIRNGEKPPPAPMKYRLREEPDQEFPKEEVIRYIDAPDGTSFCLWSYIDREDAKEIVAQLNKAYTLGWNKGREA